jgi:hypothetical protein
MSENITTGKSRVVATPGGPSKVGVCPIAPLTANKKVVRPVASSHARASSPLKVQP